jgi:Family of unknown function (DUF6152)
MVVYRLAIDFDVEVIAMRKWDFSVFVLAAGLLSWSLPLFAHHGTAVFDMSKALAVKGAVTEWDWSNPHCLLMFDAKDESGQVVHWIAETQNPANMVYAGWGKTSFKPGDEVTVMLFPAKNGKPFGRINQVVLPNGKTLTASGGTIPPPDSAGSSGTSKTANYPKP